MFSLSQQLGLAREKPNQKLYKPNLAPKMHSIVNLFDRRKLKAKPSQILTEEYRASELEEGKTCFQTGSTAEVPSKLVLKE